MAPVSDDTVKNDEDAPEVVSTAIVVAPTAALARAQRQASEYRRHTKAASTRRGYKGAWERFQAWATTNSVSALPASPDDVASHLGHLASDGYSVTTLEHFLSAAGHYHRAAGFVFPRDAFVVSDTLKGIRRKVGTKRSKKAPLGLQELINVCTRLEGPENTQNRAMLTVGWFCMLRSANLVAIRREHVCFVQIDEHGGWIEDDVRSNGFVLHLISSKTDQTKEGRDIAVHAQEDETVCPMRALLEHLRARQFAPEELIFPVSERTVSRLIKRLAADPSHDHKSLREITNCDSCSTTARRFASHSLRRGSATTQAEMGIPEREIMRQGGWKNERVMRGYIEHATLFKNNSTKGLAKKRTPK